MLTFFKGLGVGFLCLLLFVLGVIFNVEFLNKKKDTNSSLNSNRYLSFSRNIEESSKIKPDVFSAHINFWANELLSTKISLTQEEKSQISNTFNQILQRAKQDKFCTGGSYSLEPNFSYKDGVQIPKGQRLNAYLNCNIKPEELNAFNAFINDLNAIVAKSEFISVSIPSLEARFSDELLKESKEKLYDKLLTKSLEYEKKYSSDLNRTCTLRSLNITQRQYGATMPRVLNSSAKMDGVELSLPLVTEGDQKLEAIVSYICK
ncbi:hypothetical protein DU472_07035 [Campylobacter novaezeelandiae]|uniref:DUF541 domain-containing protein n=1 Tax=Campylobacter novaezeelandiae TaxID=2267891 RepID=A0A4Q9JVC7_9BACT|nr:hypothetical protein [Campylobacter novaezeelandiae]TBR78174.1 hypothetical protein DU474_07200 [Campylobacter novaezeelandiae]TBR79236.1 hypothetical protein DU472_07035 [Campylobacter novaezeelandiae]TBR80259.1 hypothetical protein DU474_02000 [Campylobacter novaezeelandiae]TBR82004.1 hypothetical protein DU473_01645 [Campylobacter novaezeelandiae]